MNSEDTLNQSTQTAQPGEPDPGILVRRALCREADEIHRLVSDSMKTYRTLSGIPENRLESSSETPADTRKAMREGIVLVATDPSLGIVGTVRLMTRTGNFFTGSSFFGSNGDTKVIYFTRFAVRQDARNQGIGSLLISEGEKFAASKGLPAIFLHTSLRNESTVAFYLSRGFEMDSVDTSRGYPRGLFFKRCNASRAQIMNLLHII